MSDLKHFGVLNSLNVNDYKEEKNGLSYLTWSAAWAETKKKYPDATYEIKKFENGLPYVFDEKTGYMVFTAVTIEGVTYEMWLPVMDNNNKAMKAEPYKCKAGNYERTVNAATMFDVNKTIMRCLVKNLAMFGLGLYIYAGEDLPEEEKEEAKGNKSPAEEEKKAIPYPPRDEMLALVRKKYPDGSKMQDALVASFGVKTIDDASDAQLMAVWNKYAEK